MKAIDTVSRAIHGLNNVKDAPPLLNVVNREYLAAEELKQSLQWMGPLDAM